MKKLIAEFKDFALQGNVMSLAVGIIIGAAFQGVVNSLVDNVLSPVIGLFAGANFDGLHLEFWGVSLRYGAFITAVINFIIMAAVVFLIVKLVNRVVNNQPEPESTLRQCSYCFGEAEKAATRCPHCTSKIEAIPEEESAD
ncbi:MAG: large conductance mechanosensitive channel protein MscL [Coriobacteriia bacterium]|nr:large conductance mechanosensitive channel protein MscL [Coriobacteriia bacterium]